MTRNGLIRNVNKSLSYQPHNHLGKPQTFSLVREVQFDPGCRRSNGMHHGDDQQHRQILIDHFRFQNL